MKLKQLAEDNSNETTDEFIKRLDRETKLSILKTTASTTAKDVHDFQVKVDKEIRFPTYVIDGVDFSGFDHNWTFSGIDEFVIKIGRGLEDELDRLDKKQRKVVLKIIKNSLNAQIKKMK
jgi:hypothetical protein